MRRARTTDRVVALVLGLLLVAGGLALVDLQTGVLLGTPSDLDLGPVRDVVDTGWWPWVFAVASVVLGLLALGSLLGRLRPGRDGSTRLTASDPRGRLVADLDSVASAVAGRLEATAPLARARGAVVRSRRGPVLSVRAHLAPDADLAEVAAAAEEAAADVVRAFPQDAIGFRLLLEEPRAERTPRNRSRRRDTVRVGEA
ncbi:hypothetical protein [Nocardioides litoris]|uniref:hypothetical protein n=1 Tax=Nocardioides litoris TaxID=1926648 RepID=UPI0011227D99|nr:hypothetical protein [Nocardioides litoris]